MTVGRLFQLTLAALLLGGCVVSTPFVGPGYDPASQRADGGKAQVVLSLTQAVLKDDSEARDLFRDYVEVVEASLPERHGFIGFSKRTELFGSNAWTMTVWSDAASLEAFVDSTPHRAAMQAAMGALVDARFARVNIDRRELPVSWERALELLENNGRHYYE